MNLDLILSSFYLLIYSALGKNLLSIGPVHSPGRNSRLIRLFYHSHTANLQTYQKAPPGVPVQQQLLR